LLLDLGFGLVSADGRLVSVWAARPFDCDQGRLRPPRHKTSFAEFDRYSLFVFAALAVVEFATAP